MKQASDFFHAEDNLNCAQSVLKYFDAPAAQIAEFKAFGGGRAPEGLCGALYAAKACSATTGNSRNSAASLPPEPKAP